MGYGSYNAGDWAKLRNSRGISTTSGADQIFRGNQLSEKYDPRFINMRESCDSADSPESTPIILGFDVTGSMGYLAAEIAKNSLNKTVTEIYDKQPVTNPHVMCAAFTGYGWEGALQVTQFEADIRIVEQLLELKVGFGGNQYSFDPFVWYFAAKHTSIDSFKKRGKKGFLFCIGDEICWEKENTGIDSAEIERIFGDKTPGGVRFRDMLKMAQKQYEVYHIITGSRGQKAIDTWTAFMPGRVAVIPSDKINYLSELIISMMQLSNGMDREFVLSQWEGEAREVVQNGLAHLQVRRSEADLPTRTHPAAAQSTQAHPAAAQSAQARPAANPPEEDHSLHAVLERIFGQKK